MVDGDGDKAARPPLRWFRPVSAALSGMGAITTFGLIVLINADVLARLLINKPVAGVIEIVELSIVAIVFLQVPYALLLGRFIRSDSLYSRILARFPVVGQCLDMAFNLAGAATFAALAYGTYPVLLEAWRDNLFVGNQGMFMAPTWPVQAIIVIGSALAALIFVGSLINNARQILWLLSRKGVADGALRS